ncbi:MAG: hypothetical protein ACRDYA_08380 [Egibacteraceae bacterium]
MRLLEIEDPSVHFPTSAGTVRAVGTVSLRLEAGEHLCLLGEPGSGKTRCCCPPARSCRGGSA